MTEELERRSYVADGRIKYFTLEEANRTLAYVKPVVSDILKAYRDWRAGVQQYERMTGTRPLNAGESDELEALRGKVDMIAKQMNEYLEELAAVGCVFKGFDDGLVDFYSKLEGRDVFLCWKFGESEISHWHELDAGFAGRRELVPELLEGEAK